jgi:hypothetical protein
MLAYFFVIFAVAMRLLPHPLAFTPVGAALLFFGARGPRRQLWVPVALLAVSDLLLNKFTYGYPFTWDQIASWVWYAAMVWVGSRFLRENARPLPIVGAALAGSISFFLLSNLAVWVVWDMYPKTLSGLMACYAAGVPFFRKAVEGDLLFTALMFAAPIALHYLAGDREPGNRAAV